MSLRIPLAFLPLLLGLIACHNDPPVARNLVIITIDTLRQDHVGAYGSDVRTPAMDRLAAEGFRFVDSFTTAPTTLPSHTSLFTGTYPHRHGIRRNGLQRVPEEAETLAEVLEAAGYETGAFVGTSVLDSFYGLDQGFDVYDDEFAGSSDSAQEQRSAEEVVLRSKEWLAEISEPYFLWVHVFDPHGPYEPPSPYDRAYYDGDPRDPTVDSMKEIPLVFYQKLDGVTDIEFPLAQYKGEVSYTDHWIGILLDAIDARPDSDRTVVLLTADHGESLGEQGYYFDHGVMLHDASLRVPLLLRVPGLSGGRAIEGPVSAVDVFPTALNLLGLRARENVEGIDLTPFLDSGRAPPRLVYFETFLPTSDRQGPRFGVRNSSWKLVASQKSRMLVHQRSDPAEARDRAIQNPKILRRLNAALRVYSEERPLETYEIDPSPLQIEKLKALGYIR